MSKSFFFETKFNEQLVPVQIDLDKLPKDSIPVEIVQEEIQASYEQGFKNGQELTQNTLEVELHQHQEWVRKFDLIAIELRKQFTREMLQLEESIASLAVMVASHILEHEVSHNSNIVIEQTKKAIEALDNDAIFRIFLHPDDVEILGQCKSNLTSNTSKLEKVEILSDSTVEKGGCILESSAGIVDARLKMQLERIKTALSDVASVSMVEILENNIEDGAEKNGKVLDLRPEAPKEMHSDKQIEIDGESVDESEIQNNIEEEIKPETDENNTIEEQ